jgi:hypothetical protein
MRRRRLADAFQPGLVGVAGGQGGGGGLDAQAHLGELGQQAQENLRSSIQRRTSGSSRFHSFSGSTTVPWRGRALSRPLAVSILTASRVTVRLAPNCLDSSPSVGKPTWAYSPVTMA